MVIEVKNGPAPWGALQHALLASALTIKPIDGSARARRSSTSHHMPQVTKSARPPGTRKQKLQVSNSGPDLTCL